MRLLTSTLRGAIAPHAPVLLPEVSPGHVAATDSIRSALGSLSFDEVDVIVLVTPHGPATGVYEDVKGSLDGFGVFGISLECATDAVFRDELTAAWGVPIIDEPVDHGALVPILILSPRVPVVVASVGEKLTAEDAARAGNDLAAALSSMSETRRVAFIASANLSSGIGPRAPFPVLPGAEPLERSAVLACETDLAGLAELAPELGTGAGSCGAGPLTAFGRVFAGTKAEVMAHEHPFGVGYLVARTAAAGTPE
ncbi:MAG: hypothetical protein ACRDKB_03995 [Actinomycetota bacterium]